LSFANETWENIRPGNVIAVQAGAEVPADILLAHSPTDTAFVDSSNIDGEVGLQ
jgi:magnesium-transporting ATPase (P-type)